MRKLVNKTFAKKPSFNIVGSLYDDLERLRDKYGFELVVLHLGEIARKTISRNVADKVWGILNFDNKIQSFDTE